MFLVASPMLRDPNFSRTVVLMCDHGPKGSLGLVINRPTNLPAAMLLPQASPTDLVYCGGPVEKEKAMVLHRQPDPIAGAVELVDGIALGGDPALMQEILCTPSGELSPNGEIHYWRAFIGYSGWGEGQLDGELAAGGWIVCPARARYVFEMEPEKVWEAVLTDLGGEYKFLTTLPLDPNMN